MELPAPQIPERAEILSGGGASKEIARYHWRRPIDFASVFVFHFYNPLRQSLCGSVSARPEIRGSGVVKGVIGFEGR